MVSGLLVCLLGLAVAKADDFTYTAVGTERYATALPSPLPSRTYAPPLSEASTLLPDKVTYTTYALDPKATSSDDGEYGQSAYNALWDGFSYSSEVPFTTTVSPTPVPSAELVFPPALPFAMDVDEGYKFPRNFIWGVASSAWQAEGGLQSEGRGPAGTLDGLGALPNEAGMADGMTASMFYFTYKQDIARLAAMGVPHLSFSISWPRILPFGVAGSPVNRQALDHYDDVINTCIEYGVTPLPTLWHYDTPINVDFDSDDMMDDFLYYAKVVMTHYADRVPLWQTFNQPNTGFGSFYRDYNSLSRIAKAHASVYRWYKDELGGRGQISLKLSNRLAYPLNGVDNATDVAAAARYQDMILGIICNPMLLGEQIPEVALKTAGLNLEPLSREEIEHINGTMDILSLDPYNAQYATAPAGGVDACAADPDHPDWPYCAVLGYDGPDGWFIGEPSESSFWIAPRFVRQQMKYVWDTYRPAGGIMVAEFGYPVAGEALRTPGEVRHDFERSLYYRGYLSEMLKAVHEDGVRMVGALGWSMVDSNEFGTMDTHFGMQAVNLTTYDRSYKRSLFDFVDLFHEKVKSCGGGRGR